MITRFHMENFRSHGDSVVELAPIALLVGPAGAGKSNLLKGLQLLQNSTRYTLPELFPPGIGEFQWVRSRWARTTDPIAFEADLSELDGFPGEQARYRLEIADSPQGLYIHAESLQRRVDASSDWQWVFQRKHRPALMGEFGFVDPYEPSILHRALRVVMEPSNWLNVRFARSIARELSWLGYYHLEVSELKSLGQGRAVSRIGYYGSGLPDFIAWAKSKPDHAPDLFENLLAKMKEILPELKDLIVTQLGSEQQGLAIRCEDYKGYIQASELSDGTLLTLGLLSILLSPVRLELLCLEEPETGLHPRRLRWLFDHLISLAYPKAGERRTQVILTTHSPDLVNLFSDMTDSILVVEAKGGRSRVRPLPEILQQLGQPVDGNQSIGHAWATGLYEGL